MVVREFPWMGRRVGWGGFLDIEVSKGRERGVSFKGVTEEGQGGFSAIVLCRKKGGGK